MKALSPLMLFTVACALCPAADTSSGVLPRSSPEKQGISSSAVLAFVDAADRQLDTMNSMMIVRHGRVVAEGCWSPYRADSPRMLFSLSKSFTSTAIGLAIAEGKLSLDDEVLKFFPEDAPAKPDDNLKAMRISDLLRMSTGHQTQPTLPDSASWTKAFLAHPVPHKPGTHFLYNTPATYMLSAILQKVTGVTTLDYLRPRLFEPLGIRNPTWGTSPQGVSLGGYGLAVRTEDIARFGQLYLRKGMWQGQRLIPAAWVETATARQTSNGSNPASDWDQGYGYQFWRCRHGVYRGDGAFGQFCIVMPEQDAVVAINSGVRNLQAVVNLVWEKLLPAMRAAPLPADRSGEEKLQRKLAQLVVPPPSGLAASSLDATVSGKRYVFPANPRGIEALAIEFGPESATVSVRTAGGESRFTCGAGKWLDGRSSFVNGLEGRLQAPGGHAVAASGAWTSENTYSVKLCLYETPFYITLVFRFTGEELLFDSEYNVAFGPTALPQLVGRASDPNP